MMKHYVHFGKEFSIVFRHTPSSEFLVCTREYRTRDSRFVSGFDTCLVLIFSYASRTKNIRNTPIINENSSYILLQQYAEEIQRLRAIINSSNKHMNSLSRSLILNDVKLDDQHSIKTICDHQISSSENSPSTKLIDTRKEN